MFAYQGDNGLVAHFARTKRIDRNRGWLGHTNRVTDLNFALVCKASSHDIFGHITTSISSRTIHFGWIFTRERTTTMPRHAAVGIDNNFATSQTAVTDRPADNKNTGWVNVVLRACM